MDPMDLTGNARTPQASWWLLAQPDSGASKNYALGAFRGSRPSRAKGHPDFPRKKKRLVWLGMLP